MRSGPGVMWRGVEGTCDVQRQFVRCILKTKGRTAFNEVRREVFGGRKLGDGRVGMPGVGRQGSITLRGRSARQPLMLKRILLG